MKYFKNKTTNEVFGYDENDPTQAPFIDNVSSDSNFEDITGAWPVVDLSVVKALKSEEMKRTCSQKIYEGYLSSALGAPYLYPCDDKDQLNINGSVTASLIPSNPPDWTTLFLCRDEDGVWNYRIHTAAHIQKVGIDCKAHLLSQLTKNAGLQALISAATTAEQVDAITWDSI